MSEAGATDDDGPAKARNGTGLKVTYLGVGEAFDATEPNTCLLVESPEVTLLLDCGLAAVARVWEGLPDIEALDAVYLSHTHADHLFGLPSLLVRYAEEGRQKPLTVLGRPGLADHVKRLADLAYPGILSKLTYQLRFGVLDPGGADRPEGTTTLNADESEAVIGDLWLRVAPTQHSIPAMALRIDWSSSASSRASLCYSGDGMWTEGSAALYDGCDLLVHECYLDESELSGHASVEAAIELYHKVRPKRMALVHLRRTLRPRRQELLRGFEDEGLGIDIPAAGEVIHLR